MLVDSRQQQISTILRGLMLRIIFEPISPGFIIENATTELMSKCHFITDFQMREIILLIFRNV